LISALKENLNDPLCVQRSSSMIYRELLLP